MPFFCDFGGHFSKPLTKFKAMILSIHKCFFAAFVSLAFAGVSFAQQPVDSVVASRGAQATLDEMIQHKLDSLNSANQSTVPKANTDSLAKAKADSVRKMNVNELTLYELRRHPYINYYQAKAIVDHRRLDGPLKSLDELGALRDFPPEAIARLKPYVIY